ncbi:MAG: hypothetical protein ACRC76_00270 [Proteocatella sp.]
MEVEYKNGIVYITTEDGAQFETCTTSSEQTELGVRVVIPSVISYKAPNGINSGDTLIVEQIKQYAPGSVKDFEYFKEDSSTKKVIFLQAGIHIGTSNSYNNEAVFINKFVKEVGRNILAVSEKSKDFNPSISCTSTIFFSDGQIVEYQAVQYENNYQQTNCPKWITQ